MVDAHLHIKYIENQQILFPENNFYFLNSTSQSDWALVEKSIMENKNTYGFFGIHPWYVKRVTDINWLLKLETLLLEYRDAGVGEIGLDGWKSEINIELQIDFFRKQLELALKLNRKVVIHCVKSWDILFGIFEEMRIKYCNGILHRFEGSKEIMKRLIDYGFYISFYYTIHTRDKLKKVFLVCPDERVLIESDADNGPDDIDLDKHYKSTALIKGMDEDSFKRLVFKNGEIFKNNKTCWRR